MFGTISLKRAIYNLLVSNGISVSNGLPINSELPYVQMGEMVVSDSSTKNTEDFEFEVTFHVWEWAISELEFYQLFEDSTILALSEIVLEDTNFYISDSKLVQSTMLMDKLNNEPLMHGVFKINYKISKNE